jgi:hypothetical protein
MTTRNKITLRNDFHNTEATVIALDEIISGRAMHRACRKLCGIDGCTCGGVRGHQDVILEILNQEGDHQVVSEEEYYGY